MRALTSIILLLSALIFFAFSYFYFHEKSIYKIIPAVMYFFSGMFFVLACESIRNHRLLKPQGDVRC